MRKILLFAVGIAFSMSAKAQKSVYAIEDMKVSGDASSVKHNDGASGMKDVTTIWSETFSAGVPATWSNSGSSVAALWEYRGPATVPAASTGSRGAYATGLGPIQSPTRANGFVIFDSDYLDNNGSTTGAGTGAAPTPHSSTLTTDAINLTGQNFVQLTFSQYYRNFRSKTSVAISTNGGITFPDTVFINNVAVNAATSTNNVVRANISAKAGNKSDVRLRFSFESTGTPANGYYFWMIDDIAITTLPINDLILENFGVDMTGYEVDYGHVPITHVKPTIFQGAVQNYGSLAQPNTKMTVKVNQGVNTIATLTSNNLLSMPYLKRDTLSTTPYTHNAVGTYSYVFSVASDSIDENPANNTTTKQYIITDSTLAVDHNSTTSTSTGTGSFTGAQDFIQMANLYTFTSPAKLRSVFVKLAAGTVAGGEIKINVYDTTGFSITNATLPPIKMGSDYYTITAANVSSLSCLIPIPTLLNGQPQNTVLPAGGYFVSAELLSNAGSKLIRIYDDLSIVKAWDASILFLPPGGANTSRWYSNGNAWGIRINIAYPTAVDELTNGGLKVNTIYPNPASNVATLQYEIEKGNNVTLTVRDITGKVVSSTSEGYRNAGANSININTESLSNGIYLYELKAGNGTINGKLSVSH